jgi:hypothetical protein
LTAEKFLSFFKKFVWTVEKNLNTLKSCAWRVKKSISIGLDCRDPPRLSKDVNERMYTTLKVRHRLTGVTHERSVGWLSTFQSRKGLVVVSQATSVHVTPKKLEIGKCNRFDTYSHLEQRYRARSAFACPSLPGAWRRTAGSATACQPHRRPPPES